ncbi:hypothetical protein C8F01DRAFT_1163318 [Mycena amicta]|nr:hypothetical protein C8F01DRAFT_1163318 [Mycena amicta]
MPQNLDALLQDLLKLRVSGGRQHDTDSVLPLLSSKYSIKNHPTSKGLKIPKRRRPEVSRLGAPEWYNKDPPPTPEMPGTAPPSPAPPYTSAHASFIPAEKSGLSSGSPPWLGLVLYSHAPPGSAKPMYHNSAKVAGEVRLMLQKPTSLGQCRRLGTLTLDLDSVLDIAPPSFMTMTACVWNRKMGDPQIAQRHERGNLQGQFPELPADVVIKYPAEERFKYTIGVNVTREGFAISRWPGLITPRPQTMFPFLPTHGDWPFVREVAAGWTLTPFGGRGKFVGERVEVEGVLGIPYPAVYTAGQNLNFTLLLWANNPTALQVLADPGAIEVGFFKSDITALNAIDPKSVSGRSLERLAGGNIRMQSNYERPPSPTGSFEELDDDEPESSAKNVACSHPSFRFISMGRQYLLGVRIKHAKYTQISPKGDGLWAETPVWYVIDRFSQADPSRQVDYAKLPVQGQVIPIPDGVVRRPMVVGEITTRKRPIAWSPRINAF